MTYRFARHLDGRRLAVPGHDPRLRPRRTGTSSVCRRPTGGTGSARACSEVLRALRAALLAQGS